MAVYTVVSAENMAEFLARYDVGELRSFKGIAEGVENSNYLVETDKARYILTLYEKRVNRQDLPFFMALLDHLADKGLPVPRAIRDRKDTQLQELQGRAACLIEFLEGVSVTVPTAEQAGAAGAALAQLHRAVGDFDSDRPNDMDKYSWHDLADRCGESLAHINVDLPQLIETELAYLDEHWPEDLPVSVIHADLFPDNILMIGNDVTGLIDFYFSCTDIRAYDLAVMHAAWCFDNDGRNFDRHVSNALIYGYRATMEQSEAEINCMRTLARGAALRFTLTRAYDLINTPADAMVTRKDPMAFARRLQYYRDPKNSLIFT